MKRKQYKKVVKYKDESILWMIPGLILIIMNFSVIMFFTINYAPEENNVISAIIIPLTIIDLLIIGIYF